MRKISKCLCLVLIVSLVLGSISVSGVQAGGKSGYLKPSSTEVNKTSRAFEVLPRTFEAEIQLSSITGRGGVILGNYKDNETDAISFEIFESGVPRLYFYNKTTGEVYSYKFNNVDIRTEDPVRLTIVRDSAAIICYVNGVEKQRLTSAETGVSVSNMLEALPPSSMVVGGDLREGNAQYFKGNIYNVAVWSDVRTASEISSSTIDLTDSALIAAYDFSKESDQQQDMSNNGYDLSGNLNIVFPIQGIYSSYSTNKGLGFTADVNYKTENTLNPKPRSVLSWIYLPRSFEDRGGVIIGNYHTDEDACVSFEINKDGNPRFFYLNKQGKVANVLFSTVDARSDGWVQLAFTVDDSTNSVSCYLNGVLQDTIKCTANIDFEDITAPYSLGGDLRSLNAQYFKGKILEVALYEEVVSADDIYDIYVNGVNNNDINPLSYYSLVSANPKENILDMSGNGNDMKVDMRYFSTKESVTDYAYSFAVIGDTQTITIDDVKHNKNNLSRIYNWLLDNKDSKKIKYVFGLGDITDTNVPAEWQHAKQEISKLDGQIDYSLVRGNHDVPTLEGNVNDKTDYFSQYLGTSAYKSQFESGGFYAENDIFNSWRTLTVGTVDYLLMNLDFGPTDAVLNWANFIISEHPYHNVIITTHAYLYRDGTTLDAGDIVPPSCYGTQYNNGDQIWDKLISKHENIVLVLSGHDPCENIVLSQDKGENGNIVTSMLVDPQYVDRDEGATGMVAMLYFSEDGSKVQVEYYSTVREEFFLKNNQFSFEIAVVDGQGDPNKIAGDINGDNEVDNKDLIRLFQHLSDWGVEVNEQALDINGDRAVDNKDLIRLFQYLSDWEVRIF